MSLQEITLVSFGYFEKKILEQSAEAVRLEFNHPVSLREGHLDLSEFYDPARHQYNGNLLLNTVDHLPLPENSRILGLFNVDLYIPILTFIFGQAYLGGRTGIASMYRLSNKRYGIAANESLLIERFIKEVIHELGHMYGMIHCHHATCVMRSSTYVEDIDQKEGHFCTVCREKLRTLASQAGS
jgi:archaemetzincin